jgi:hypothetical protein
MNCSQGDQAVIVFSLRPQNVGREVHVAEYIGKFSEREHFQFRGMLCEAPISDHYWWVEAEDLDIKVGPSPRAYIADSWLRPIKPPKVSLQKEEEKELDILA